MTNEPAKEIDNILKNLCNSNPSNLKFCYLNVNSIRNKFSDLQKIVNGNIDIVSIAETKLDGSFPSAQFFWEGYKAPYRLDISNRSGGLLLYIKSSIPSRLLHCGNICNLIQAIAIEINLRKEKWLVISIYRPPKQNSEYFLNQLTKMIDHFTDKYENYIIMGDFNLQPNESVLKDFLSSNNLTNLIKSNTCFKGSGSCIDLILTNRKFSFKHTSSYETGISDHHHMIYTMLKSCFKNAEPIILNYRDYKRFSKENFDRKLEESLTNCGDSYDDFQNIFVSELNKHAPKKKKVLRGNNKPHIDKILRKAIMKRSRLKNKANKTKNPRDISNYKKLRHYVESLIEVHNFNILIIAKKN